MNIFKINLYEVSIVEIFKEILYIGKKKNSFVYKRIRKSMFFEEFEQRRVNIVFQKIFDINRRRKLLKV